MVPALCYLLYRQSTDWQPLKTWSNIAMRTSRLLAVASPTRKRKQEPHLAASLRAIHARGESWLSACMRCGCDATVPPASRSAYMRAAGAPAKLPLLPSRHNHTPAPTLLQNCVVLVQSPALLTRPASCELHQPADPC